MVVIAMQLCLAGKTGGQPSPQTLPKVTELPPEPPELEPPTGTVHVPPADEPPMLRLVPPLLPRDRAPAPSLIAATPPALVSSATDPDAAVDRSSGDASREPDWAEYFSSEEGPGGQNSAAASGVATEATPAGANGTAPVGGGGDHRRQITINGGGSDASGSGDSDYDDGSGSGDDADASGGYDDGKCLTSGIWYLPLDGIAHEGRTSMSAEQCQQRCADTCACKYFNSFPDGGCHVTTGALGMAANDGNPTALAGHWDCGASDVQGTTEPGLGSGLQGTAEPGTGSGLPTLTCPTRSPTRAPTSPAPSTNCFEDNLGANLPVVIVFVQPGLSMAVASAFDPQTRIMLTARCETCDSSLPNSVTTYEWGSGVPPGSGCAATAAENTTAGENAPALLRCAEHTASGCSSESLVINAHSNLTALDVYLKVTVRSTAPGSILAPPGSILGGSIATIVLVANTPPQGGGCAIESSARYLPLSASYRITCSNFTDDHHPAVLAGAPGGNAAELGFRFSFQIDQGTATYVACDGAAHVCDVYLPLGSLTFRYAVYDRYGSAATHAGDPGLTQAVVVEALPAVEMAAVVSNAVSGDNSMLAQMIAANNSAASVNLLASLASVIFSAEASEVNETVSDIVLQATLDMVHSGASLSLGVSSSVLGIAGTFTSGAVSAAALESCTSIITDVISRASATDGDTASFAAAAVTAAASVIDMVGSGGAGDTVLSAASTLTASARVSMINRVENAIAQVASMALAQRDASQGILEISMSRLKMLAKIVDCNTGGNAGLESTGSTSKAGFAGVCGDAASDRRQRAVGRQYAFGRRPRAVGLQYATSPYPLKDGALMTPTGAVVSLEIHDDAGNAIPVTGTVTSIVTCFTVSFTVSSAALCHPTRAVML